MVAFGLFEKFRHKETAKWLFWGLATVLLLVAFYQAWSDEHRNSQVLIDEKADIRGKLASCTGDLRASDGVRQLLEAQTRSQQLTINAQQSTTNTCVVTLAKTAIGEPPNVYVWTVGIGIIKRPVVTEMVLVTNRRETFRGNLECTEPFNVFDWTMTGTGVRMGVGTQKISARQYHLETTSPLWEPHDPIVVNAISDQTLHGCKFTIAP